jgi:hypothetical protein
MGRPSTYQKEDRQMARGQRRAEKLLARRQQRKQAERIAARDERFPSAFPDAPEAYDGIARTLSRGL